MSIKSFQLPIGRIILVAISIVIIDLLIGFAVVSGYAFYLAIKGMGAPDHQLISSFARNVSPLLRPLLAIILTFIGARWLTGKSQYSNKHTGLILGIIVVIFVLIVDFYFAGKVKLIYTLWYGLILVGGWIGGKRKVDPVSESLHNQEKEKK